MRFLISFAAVCATLLCLAGCGGGTGQPYVTPERLDKGLVIVLPGICGRLWVSESIRDGLADGGVEQAVEIYDWTYHGRFLPLYNLGAIKRNHRVAGEIAQHVREYRNAHPGRPVTLVGYSGGASLAVWTAEAMPEGGLDGIVLLSAPLTPQYDLAPALARSAKGIISFYSDSDVIFMDLGTVVFGTMDKQHVASAGNLGFVAPGAASPALGKPAGSVCAPQAPAQAATTQGGSGAASQPAPYGRLYQIPWQPEMSQLGYDGTHLTIGARAFVAQYVAPLVGARAWDEPFVTGVSCGQCRVPATCPAQSGKR